MKRYFDYDGLKAFLAEQGIEIEGFMCNAYAQGEPGHFSILMQEPSIRQRALGGVYTPDIEDYWVEVDE